MVYHVLPHCIPLGIPYGILLPAHRHIRGEAIAGGPGRAALGDVGSLGGAAALGNVVLVLSVNLFAPFGGTISKVVSYFWCSQ